MANELTLPELREDLKLIPGPTAFDGSPTWQLYDAVRNIYFQLGWIEIEILKRWDPENKLRTLAKINQETTLRVSMQQIDALSEFFSQNELAQTDEAELFTKREKQRKKHPFKNLLHSYLYFKIPLVKPDKFLTKTLPYVQWLGTREAAIGFFVMLIAACYLITRQWSAFTHSAANLFSVSHIIFYAIAIIGTKIAHEFAHAYVAKRYGCHIREMGVAFIVMWPVLYTDTTDAWKLSSHRERIHIAAAGMIAELGVAIVALFLWHFLPEGPIKTAAFFLATVSWMLTLFVNLNPFMRFDGYYLLSDYLRVSNLQKKSFDLAKWHLRQYFFGIVNERPYYFPDRLHKLLIVHAYGTWIYRFFLFLGIALLVYHFFFKVLGIFLMAVELIYFIGLPIYRESKMIWKQRGQIRAGKPVYRTFILLAIILVILIFPWRSSLKTQGVLRFAQPEVFYAPFDAHVLETPLNVGAAVRTNDRILVLHAPSLAHRVEQIKSEISVLDYRLRKEYGRTQRFGATQADKQLLEEKRAQLETLDKKQQQLTLRAKGEGVLIDMAPDLHPGVYVAGDTWLATVANPAETEVITYLDEHDVSRIQVGDSAQFSSDNRAIPDLTLTVSEISPTSAKALSTAYLSSEHGGDIETEVRGDEQYALNQALFSVRLTADEAITIDRAYRGTLYIEGEAESLISRAYLKVAQVLVQESGF